MADYEDPGWRFLDWRLFIPGMNLIALRRRARSDALTSSRTIFVGIFAALWLFTYLLLYIVPRARGGGLSETSGSLSSCWQSAD